MQNHVRRFLDNYGAVDVFGWSAAGAAGLCLFLTVGSSSEPGAMGGAAGFGVLAGCCTIAAAICYTFAPPAGQREAEIPPDPSGCDNP